MSAGPINSPRTEGLIGVASTRTTTSSSAGSGGGTLARDSSSSPLFLSSVRSCNPLLPSLMSYPPSGRPAACRFALLPVQNHFDMVAAGNDVKPHERFQQKPSMPIPSPAAPSIAATSSRPPLIQSPALQIALCVAVVVALSVLRAIFAVTIELRVDEAYYWTWSRESVISFLDH